MFDMEPLPGAQRAGGHGGHGGQGGHGGYGGHGGHGGRGGCGACIPGAMGWLGGMSPTATKVPMLQARHGECAECRVSVYDDGGQAKWDCTGRLIAAIADCGIAAAADSWSNS
jgi:hypothetical protein